MMDATVMAEENLLRIAQAFGLEKVDVHSRLPGFAIRS